MYHQSDFRILSALRQKSLPPAEIASRTGLARDTVVRRVKDLREYDLVARVDDGDESDTVYQRRQTGVAAAFDRAADSVPHVDLGAFLTPSLLKVIYWLRVPLGPSAIASRIDLSRVRVQQLLSTLVQRQFVTKPERGRYELKAEYGRLLALTEEAAHHRQWCEVRDVLPDATIVWAAPCEALVVPGESTKRLADELVADTEWTVTGVAAYREFGLEFTVADGALFYRNATSDEERPELTAPDVVCHALRRRLEHRLLRFTALLVLQTVAESETDVAAFASTAEVYGVEGAMEDLLRYLETEGDTSSLSPDVAGHFPSWDRVVETGDQYGLDVRAMVTELDR